MHIFRFICELDYIKNILCKNMEAMGLQPDFYVLGVRVVKNRVHIEIQFDSACDESHVYAAVHMTKGSFSEAYEFEPQEDPWVYTFSIPRGQHIDDQLESI